MKYKVGDKVRIKSLDWYNENKDKVGNIRYERDDSAYPVFFSKYMSNFCGEILTIKSVFKHSYHMNETSSCEFWTDEMIEELVEKATEPKLKFKVGDKVITDTNMKGKIIEVVEEGWYRVEFEPCNGIPQPNGVVPEESMSLMEEKCNCVQVDNIPDVIQAKTSSACSHNGFYGYSDSERNKTSEWYLPEGYQFTDENGNVIPATKIVLEKKKKEYPKTYEECLKILGIKLSDCYIQGYKSPLLEDLQKLLICRDAYWKIAGEEMGLGKPWESDWAMYSGLKHCIIYSNNEIKWRCKSFVTEAKILAFPTVEMRDAFYDNFKKEIEICKELL